MAVREERANVVDRDKVSGLLRKAVQAAYDGERVLFEERTLDRSIVFHIHRRVRRG